MLLEVKRWALVAGLRRTFDATCREHFFGAKPPAEAFNGWVFETMAAAPVPGQLQGDGDGALHRDPGRLPGVPGPHAAHPEEGVGHVR